MKPEGECSHPASLKGLCVCCGDHVAVSGVPLGYVHKDLRVGKDEIVRLRNSNYRGLLKSKKLYLVLDLDHTLLNSTRSITGEEEYLMSRVDSSPSPKGDLFKLDSIRMMTKLRPYVRTFLENASKLFDMCIFTMGDTEYAYEMVRLLDPHGIYFSSKVISRADCTRQHKKDLDMVLGAADTTTLILDDTESVWSEHRGNLILMERYHFFASSPPQFHLQCKSLSETKTDENELDGPLANALQLLTRVHHAFFSHTSLDDLDVRLILKEFLHPPASSSSVTV